MERVEITKGLSISRLIHGHWRVNEWGYQMDEFKDLIYKLQDIGITTFDHADIYGDYTCENHLGQVLKRDPALRNKIQIISKCGIKLLSSKFPERKVKHYDYSYSHIVGTVEQSLKNLSTDHIDILLLHRPSPFMVPEEVAKAFDHLKSNGKVLSFGVSNFTPIQYSMLESYLSESLVTNQIELSVGALEHFDNGNIDFLLKQRVKPMAWSPLARGVLFNPEDKQSSRIVAKLNEIGEEVGGASISQVALLWLLSHPIGIMPILGSGKWDRLEEAVDSMNFSLSIEQWFGIYEASMGVRVP
ncbi:aldo/keto reductase [Prolixibacteraceae bacterium]|nr:aldo/keto reductase [Prolixibacteraceae bacterium]